MPKASDKSKNAGASSIGPNGDYVQRHRDGSIWAKGKMVGRVMEGYWEWFRKDGTIMRSGYFKKGKQVGKWTTYDQDGKAFKVTDMSK